MNNGIEKPLARYIYELMNKLDERLDYPTELICFAWLCAMRSLPFLSNLNSFDYWSEEDKPKHLFSIFRSLDLTIEGLYTDADNYDSTALNQEAA